MSKEGEDGITRFGISVGLLEGLPEKANWIVALMECPRGMPKDLCLANQMEWNVQGGSQQH
jgi:hypothetical protein